MKKPFRKIADMARVVAGFAVIFVAGRFAFVAVRAAAAKADAAPAASSSAAPPARGQDRGLRSSSPSTTATPPPTALPGTPVRVTLMVTAGADRSDVIADDAPLGKTPFVGDFSCRAGETVRFRIVPPRGAPLELERTCAPGTMRVEQ